MFAMENHLFVKNVEMDLEIKMNSAIMEE